MKTRCKLLVSTFILIWVQPVFAGDAYVRKGVSFVPHVAIVSNTATIPLSLQTILSRSFQHAVALERFDVNQLSERSISEYRDKCKLNLGSIDQLKDIITKAITPQIRKILEDSALSRAGQLVDQADSNRFITQMAKETGVTAEDIQQILQTAYIAVPFVSSYQFKDSRTEASYTISAGVLWYHLATTASGDQIEYVGDVQHSATGSARYIDSTFNSSSQKWTVLRHDKGEVRERAFSLAAGTIASRLIDRIKDVSPFRLTSNIVSVKGSRIEFSLVTGNQVSVDDKFHVAEYVVDDHNPDAPPKLKNIGYARVIKGGGYGNNGTFTAKVIRSSRKVDIGMTIVEHSRNRNDVRIGMIAHPIRINSGRLAHENTTYIGFNSTVNDTLYFVNLGVMTNQAKLVGASQYYNNLDFMVAITPRNGAMILGEDNGLSSSGISFGINLNVLKKCWTGPFAMDVGGGVGALIIHQAYSVPDSTTQRISSVAYSAFGWWMNAAVGFEYSLSIDVNVGMSVGYWVDMPGEKWWLRMNRLGKNKKEALSIDNTDKPSLNLSGPELRLYIACSLL